MNVAEVMTVKVITAAMDDTLGGIKKILELKRIHHIPIVENDRLMGIVSDRDLLINLSPYIDTASEDNRALNTLKKKAHQVMTRRVITVSSDDTIDEAADTMLKKKISCLPVLALSGEIVGMVTKTDLLRSLVEQGQAASV